MRVWITLDDDERDSVTERERNVLARRIHDRRIGHQSDGTRRHERDQAQHGHETQQLWAETVEQQSPSQVVHDDHHSGRHYAGGRQHGRRFSVSHGRGHQGAGQQEHGQYRGHEVRVEHADPGVADQLGGIRHEHQRPGQLLEREVQAQRQERPVDFGTVDMPEEVCGRPGRRVTGRRRRDQSQLESGVLGVAEPAPGLQPRGTLGHERADQHERRGGGQQRDRCRLRVAEQWPGQVHAQHAHRDVDDRPGRGPRRETLGAVRGSRHGYEAHKRAGKRAARQQINRGQAAHRQDPTDRADHVAQQYRAPGPERVDHALRDQATRRGAQGG